MSTVSVNTYTHSVTHVTDQMLRSLKYIIRESGLDPAKFAGSWETTEQGIYHWLLSKHLQRVILEVSNPANNRLVGRWDFDIDYSYGADDDGFMWLDTDALKHSIYKQGLWPSTCDYRVVVTTKDGAPSVSGWSNTTLRSTDGFVRQSIGTTIGASGLGSSTGYWRKN